MGIVILGYQYLSSPIENYEFGMDRIHNLELSQNGCRIYETGKQMNRTVETYQT